jgi:signal peptide peptidase SppA
MISPAIRFLSNQVWAIHPPVFESLIALIEAHSNGARNPLAYAEDRQAPKSKESEPQIIGRTAIIPVRGVIARYADQINGACQDAGRSAESLQADLMKMDADPRVDSIILRMDTPGGTVAGTAETGDVIKSLSKKTTAFVDGMCASAGYWLASQCNEVVMGGVTSEVGSIGVITAHVDSTKAQDKAGYKVTVFRTAALKAPGAMGESLNPEQYQAIQRDLADFDSAFQDAVQSGRGMTDEQMKLATTGEMWRPAQAIAMGLADRVATLNELLGIKSTVADNRATEHPTTKAQVDAAQEAIMPFTIEALAALSKRHPAHSALILEEGAKPDATEAGIIQAVYAAEESAHAAKFAEMSAKLDAAHAAQADMEAHVVQLKAELEKIKGHATAHADPGGDDQGAAPAPKKRSQMGRPEKAAFIKEHGKDAFLALEA